MDSNTWSYHLKKKKKNDDISIYVAVAKPQTVSSQLKHLCSCYCRLTSLCVWSWGCTVYTSTSAMNHALTVWSTAVRQQVKFWQLRGAEESVSSGGCNCSPTAKPSLTQWSHVRQTERWNLKTCDATGAQRSQHKITRGVQPSTRLKDVAFSITHNTSNSRLKSEKEAFQN